MNLFVGYVGFDDGEMKPVAIGSDHDTVFSETLANIATMGLLRGSQMVVQDKGEISEVDYRKTKSAFDEAFIKVAQKSKAA